MEIEEGEHLAVGVIGFNHKGISPYLISRHLKYIQKASYIRKLYLSLL
jgi:hypothetical protein